VRKQKGWGECNEEVETIILVDGCKFIEKDDLDFTFIWVHDRRDRRGGIRQFIQSVFEIVNFAFIQ